jgi:LysM repeat protein
MKKYLLTFILVAMLSIVSIGVARATPGLQEGRMVHYVTYGESLYSIAAKYGVSVEAVLRQNGLVPQSMIYVGQPLVIPSSRRNSNVYEDSGDTSSCTSYHIVKAGEVLPGIAFDYGIPLQQLMQYNQLQNVDIIYVGQLICLPARGGYLPQSASYQNNPTENYGPPASYSPPTNYNPPAKDFYHRVLSGDTLHAIAARYGVSYPEIMRANNLNNAEFIMVGQRLLIPGYRPVPLSQPALSDSNKYDESKPQYSPQAVAPTGGTPLNSEENKVPDNSSSLAVNEPPVLSGPANDQQSAPARASAVLPKANQPMEVAIVGDAQWAGKAYTQPDYHSITTLIVKTGAEYGLNVKVRGDEYAVDGFSDTIFLGEFGPNRFVVRYIPPGEYDVMINDRERSSEIVHVNVAPGQRVEVLFDEGVSFTDPTLASPDGWVLGSWDNPSQPGKNLGAWSNVLVKTPATGLWVKIESAGSGYSAKCFTGTKGPGACDFAGLASGLYWIWIDGTDFKVKTYMDGNAYATFEFARQPESS